MKKRANKEDEPDTEANSSSFYTPQTNERRRRGFCCLFISSFLLPLSEKGACSCCCVFVLLKSHLFLAPARKRSYKGRRKIGEQMERIFPFNQKARLLVFFSCRLFRMWWLLFIGVDGLLNTEVATTKTEAFLCYDNEHGSSRHAPLDLTTAAEVISTRGGVFGLPQRMRRIHVSMICCPL